MTDRGTLLRCLCLLLASCTELADPAPASPDASAAGADGGSASGRDGGPRCTPRASSACFEGHLHWLDSCGERGELREECTDGCRGARCEGAGGSSGGGAGGSSGGSSGGDGGNGASAGSAPADPLPDGAACETGDQCMSTFCVDTLCTTPASCEAAVCDGGRACTAEDSCECPAGTFVDGACCGDGVKQTREDCDDGGSNSDSAPNACRTSCTSAGCGDGVVDTGEICDDDNTTAGDGCSATCRPEVTAIDCGGSSCCALFSDGRLKCWGSNASGALGVEATLYGNDDAMLGNAAGEMGSALPNVLVGVTAFSHGGNTVCAVSSGQLYCWGANLNGFIRGSPTSDVMTPRAINVGAPVKSVAVAGEHACVLTTSDAVRCWGNNTDGQLATGNETPLYPVSGVVAATTINLGGTAKTVLSGGKRSCAILTNDTLKCWGDNFNGALGIGSAAAEWGSLPGETAPLALSFSAAFSVQQVDLGSFHSCAVSTQGTARCWGENEYGKLGIGSTTASNVPSADLLLVGAVKQIDAGGASTIALMTTGKVRVWGVGGDLHGRPGVTDAIGNGAGEIEQLQDIDLGTGVLARSVTIGVGFACALTTDARVKCWGNNASGELGHDNTTPRGGTAGDMGDNLPYTVFD